MYGKTANAKLADGGHWGNSRTSLEECVCVAKKTIGKTGSTESANAVLDRISTGVISGRPMYSRQCTRWSNTTAKIC